MDPKLKRGLRSCMLCNHRTQGVGRVMALHHQGSGGEQQNQGSARGRPGH